MEDYKEKYENALERAKNIRFGNPQSGTANTVCEQIFPELKENESEDERIRKELVEFVNQYGDKFFGQIAKASTIAWLEKQGWQKSAWSEEDEKLLNLSLENLIELKNRFGEKYGKVGDCIHWLESIKERIGE